MCRVRNGEVRSRVGIESELTSGVDKSVLIGMVCTRVENGSVPYG